MNKKADLDFFFYLLDRRAQQPEETNGNPLGELDKQTQPSPFIPTPRIASPDEETQFRRLSAFGEPVEEERMEDGPID